MEHKTGSVIISVDKHIGKSKKLVVQSVAGILDRAMDSERAEIILMTTLMEMTNKDPRKAMEHAIQVMMDEAKKKGENLQKGFDDLKKGFGL